MSPRLPRCDIGDARHGDIVAFCDAGEWFAVSTALADNPDVVRGELGGVISKPTPWRFTQSVIPGLLQVSPMVTLGQVSGIDANLDVAGMQNQGSLRDGTMVDLKGQPVRADQPVPATPSLQDPITRRGFSASPEPAIVWTQPVHLAPKPLNQCCHDGKLQTVGGQHHPEDEQRDSRTKVDGVAIKVRHTDRYPVTFIRWAP